MAKGILAQAQARLPANMGGSQGAVRDVPASFTGGQGQSLGIYQPPKRGGGGGGGGRLKLPKKKAPKGLVDDWKKTLAQLQENVNKGYITQEQASAIAAKLKPLYQELGEKYGQPHQYSQELKNAISKYGNIRDGVDYETVKAIHSNNQFNVKTGEKLPIGEQDTPESVAAAREAAKNQALLSGQWARAEELGASESEIIARGGILVGTQLVQEGPETYEVNEWQTAEHFTPAGTGYAYDGDTLHLGDDQFSVSELEERTDWDAGQDDFSVDEFLSTDTSGGFDDYYVDDSFDWQDYHDTSSYSDTDSWSDDSGYGVGNKGGVIRKAGGGNVTVDPRGFPGKPMGTDRVPVWAEEGEYIVTREGTQKFKPLLDKINAYRPPSGTVDGAMSQLDDLINKYAQGGKI